MQIRPHPHDEKNLGRIVDYLIAEFHQRWMQDPIGAGPVFFLSTKVRAGTSSGSTRNFCECIDPRTWSRPSPAEPLPVGFDRVRAADVSW